MKDIFIGKNNKPYFVNDLDISKVLKNIEILSNYSMKELDELYKKYFGDYSYTYLSILSQKIKIYDNSSEVNSFIIGNTEFWLDKNTRVGLMHLANCSTSDMLLVLGDTILTVSPDKAKEFLAELERYAAECYLTTQKHLIAIKLLKTVEDIINYDYTKGYPNKITFNG